MQKPIDMKIEPNRKVILDLLESKAALKQNIAADATKFFEMFKSAITTEIEELKKHVKDPRIRLFCKDIGAFEKHVYIGSDVLVFHQHNNVFKMPDKEVFDAWFFYSGTGSSKSKSSRWIL